MHLRSLTMIRTGRWKEFTSLIRRMWLTILHDSSLIHLGKNTLISISVIVIIIPNTDLPPCEHPPRLHIQIPHSSQTGPCRSSQTWKKQLSHEGTSHALLQLTIHLCTTAIWTQCTAEKHCNLYTNVHGNAWNQIKIEEVFIHLYTCTSLNH